MGIFKQDELNSYGMLVYYAMYITAVKIRQQEYILYCFTTVLISTSNMQECFDYSNHTFTSHNLRY